MHTAVDLERTTSPPKAKVAGSPLIALLTIATLVRVIIVLAYGDIEPTIADAKDYDHLATELVSTGRFQSESGQLISLRPPLYPFLVAGAYQAFGEGNYLSISILQAALSLLTIVLTYRLGTVAYGERIGLLAGGIVAFYPSLLAFNCLLLSETLFTCLLTGAVLASIVLLRTPSLLGAVAFGICLGLGALTRSVLWLCVVPVSFAIIGLAGYDLTRRAVLMCASLVLVFAIVAPWAWRNTRLQETFTLIDVMGGRNVMMGNYEHTPLERSWATITDVTGDKAWHRVLAAETPRYKELSQGEIDKRAMSYGIRYFFSHPEKSAKRCLIRFFNFWQLDRTIVAGLRQGVFGEVSSIVTLGAAAIFCGSYALVALLALYGFWLSPPDWRTNGVLLLWIAIPCIIHTVAFAHSRYHLPLIPILSVYAAAGIDRLRLQPTLLNSLEGFAALLCCIVLMLGWIRELILVDFASVF